MNSDPQMGGALLRRQSADRSGWPIFHQRPEAQGPIVVLWGCRVPAFQIFPRASANGGEGGREPIDGYAAVTDVVVGE